MRTRWNGLSACVNGVAQVGTHTNSQSSFPGEKGHRGVVQKCHSKTERHELRHSDYAYVVVNRFAFPQRVRQEIAPRRWRRDCERCLIRQLRFSNRTLLESNFFEGQEIFNDSALTTRIMHFLCVVEDARLLRPTRSWEE